MTLESDNDVNVYTLELILSCSWNRHYLFAAKWPWWIVSLTGLQQGLIVYIDNLQIQTLVNPKYIRVITSMPRDVTRHSVDWQAG